MTDSPSFAAGSKNVRGFRAYSFVVQEATVARGLPAALIRPVAKQLPPRVFRYIERPPDRPFLPVQAPAVDRRKNFEQLSLTPGPDQEIEEDGVKKIVRFSRFGQFGLDPSDPAPFNLSIPFGIAICPTLASYAAARCGRR
jgi:hypothetical protein